MTPPIFAKRWLTLSEVTGRVPTEDQVVEIVRRYSTLAWLMILARIDRCLLFRQVNLETQCQIATAMLGPASEAVVRAIKSKDAIAFHDQQLRYALRLALLNGNATNDPNLNSDAAVRDVASVLLAINDLLIDPESLVLQGNGSQKEKDRAFLNLTLRGGEAFRRTLTARAMVREYELLISIPRQIDAVAALALERDMAVDLEVDLPATIALGYAILSHSFGTDPFTPDVPLAIQDPMAWFKGVGVDEATKRRFLYLMTQDLVHAQANAKAADRLAQLYDYEKFETWPIIRMPNDTIVVPSTELLFRRTSSGMYPLLSHLAKRKKLTALRERVQRRRAGAYEHVIRAPFDPNGAEVRLLARRTYQGADGMVVEAGDAILVDHARRRVVVLESKSGQIDRQDRLVGSADDLFDEESPLHAALVTLSRLVRDIRDGVLDVGIPSHRIENIAPLIVAADEFFWTPHFRARLIREADARFLRTTSQVIPSSVTSLDAVDVVRTGAMDAQSFVNALFDWQADRAWCGTTLNNYLRVRLGVVDPIGTVDVGLKKLLFETIVPDLKLPAEPPAPSA